MQIDQLRERINEIEKKIKEVIINNEELKQEISLLKQKK